MNIVVIQTAFIGDVALSIFFANDLKQIFPNCKITFVSTKIGCEISKCFYFIDNSIVYDKRRIHKGLKGLQTIANNINESNRIDYVFAIHKSYRTALLVKKINAKTKIGYDKMSLAFFLDKKVKYKKDIHEVNRNRLLLRDGLNVDSSLLTNKIDISYLNTKYISNSRSNFINENSLNNDRYIVVATGSVWTTKRWLPNYFAKLCDKISEMNYNILLVGSEKEKDICNEVFSELNDVTKKKNNIKNLAGKTTISQLMEIIKFSSLVITNDSSPTHFASIFNIPTITIYGPTSPSFGFYPLADNSIVIEKMSVKCRPCSIHGKNKCPQKHFECMKNINPEIVFENVKKLLKN